MSGSSAVHDMSLSSAGSKYEASSVRDCTSHFAADSGKQQSWQEEERRKSAHVVSQMV